MLRIVLHISEAIGIHREKLLRLRRLHWRTKSETPRLTLGEDAKGHLNSVPS
jgi:hypothetical protein